MREANFTVYKASAGSGKTFTLAVEFISLLLSTSNAALHRAVLAVTFTNKATLEMKSRILEQLYGLANELPESSVYEKNITAITGLSHAVICQRAQQVLHHILHDYDHFRIETIDSFFQSILSNLAHELNLPAGLQVDINDREVIESAVDRFITDLQPHTQLLNWTLDYIRERIADNQRWDIRREVKSFAMNLVDEHYLINEEKLTSVLSDSQALEAYKALLLENKARAVDIVQSAATHMLDTMEANGVEEKTFSNGRFLFSHLRNLQNAQFKEPNATLCKYMDGAENWVRKNDLKNSSLMQLIHDELLPLLTQTERFRCEQQQIYNSCLLTLQHLNPLRLLNAINEIVSQINLEQNRFMLAKTPILLHRIVGNDDASFIFEKAGNRFHHIMIDEFQDTSLLQWRNFKNLLLENLSSGNRCLLVGDIKQSIYRWRNGDWSILHAIAGEFPHTPIEEKRLTTNYRSEPAVIQFNNRFFADAAHRLDQKAPDGNIRLASLYADVAQASPHTGEGGYVRVHLLSDKDKESAGWEAKMLDEMAEEIRRMHDVSGVSYTHMAILIRNNRHSQAIVDHFATCCSDIPLVSNEAFLLSASYAVNTVIHALRLLNDETDSTAAAFLALQAQRHAPDASQTGIRTAFEAPVSLLPAAFVEQMPLLRRLPLYETIERIVRLFRLTDDEGQMAYIQTFLDEALAYLSDHTSDIAALLSYWEETMQTKAIPVSDQINGIRILTIHKAKGLQYHTLFMPYVNWKIESDRPTDLLWCRPPSAPYDTLPLVPVSTTAGTALSVYADAYEEEHFQRRIENLNLLYVGFTRAEKNLFVWGTGQADGLDKKTATVGDLTAAVLSAHATAEENGELLFCTGTPCGEVKKTEETPTTANRMHLPVTVTKLTAYPVGHFTQFRQSNQSYEFTHPVEGAENDATADYILRGNILHNIFSTIATRQDIGPTLDALQQRGLLPDTISRASILSLFNRGMENPVVADWFNPRWTLFRECDILTHDAQGVPVTRRPDRVMICGSEAIVVDFKFGNPHDAHRRQVEEYVRILQDMGYESPKGYLWYVYTNRIVPVSHL